MIIISQDNDRIVETCPGMNIFFEEICSEKRNELMGYDVFFQVGDIKSFLAHYDTEEQAEKVMLEIFQSIGNSKYMMPEPFDDEEETEYNQEGFKNLMNDVNNQMLDETVRHFEDKFRRLH